MQGKLINARQGKDARQGAQGKGRKAKQRALGKGRQGKGPRHCNASDARQMALDKSNGASKAKGTRQSPQYKAMHMEQSKGKCARQGKQNAQEKPKAY